MERGLKHQFDPKTRTWSKEIAEIQIDEAPFAEGSFRRAHMGKIMINKQPVAFVIKFAIDKSTPKTLYFNDVEAQVFAKVWAQKFNTANPPKQIDFVDCFVLELVDRPGRPVAGCELYIPGKFTKKNNNVGAVVAPSKFDVKIDLDIAQAFSHYSFEKSNQTLLICDIQGVENAYTDPQIHTQNGEGFGGGNLGLTGIRAFLLRHTCNDVCKQVGLQTMEAKGVPDEKNVAGSNENPKATSSRLASSTPSRPQSVSHAALMERQAAAAAASSSPSHHDEDSTSTPATTSFGFSPPPVPRKVREQPQDKLFASLVDDPPESKSRLSGTTSDVHNSSDPNTSASARELAGMEKEMQAHLDGLDLDS